MKLWSLLVHAPLALLVFGERENQCEEDGTLTQEEKSSGCIHQENDFRAPDFDHSKLKVRQGRLGTLYNMTVVL